MSLPARINDKNTNTGPSDKPISNVDDFVGEILTDLHAGRLQLPTLPQLAIKINRAIVSDQISTKKLAKMISADPAMSARLIQVSNSALVRGDKNIDNVKTAVTRMGTGSVQNVVTAFLVKQLFSAKHIVLKKQLAKIWQHSTHVAAISHILASVCSDVSPEEAMMAGLMHDIGKLPIIAKATKIPNLDKNMGIVEAVLAKLHTTLGATIMSTWEFPEYIVTAVAEHENIERDSKQLDHTDIVIVADILSHMGQPGNKIVNLNEVPALKKLSLDSANCIQVLNDAHDEMLEIQKMLSA